MASQYYIQYVTSENSSSLILYVDSYGTPEATGSVLGVWQGSGPGVEWSNGEPNTRKWTEKLSGAFGETTVKVWNAGGNDALISVMYQDNEIFFDAASLSFNTQGFNTGYATIGPPTDRRPPGPESIPVLAKLQILSEPTDSTDAATKAYVDTQSGGGD